MYDTEIKGYDSLGELAEDIGNLRYDKLAEFFGVLRRKLMKDEQVDLGRARGKLSMCLRNCSGGVQQAQVHAEHAWKICKLKMREKR